MMTTITWTTFWTTAAIMLISYYLIFGIYFYSGALKELIRKPQQPDLRPLSADDGGPGIIDEIQQPLSEEEEIAIADTVDVRVESLIEQLKEGIATASEDGEQPTAFKKQLSDILQKFPDLKDSPFQPAINEFMVKECTTYGAIAMSEDDAAQLW